MFVREECEEAVMYMKKRKAVLGDYGALRAHNRLLVGPGFTGATTTADVISNKCLKA